MPIEVVPFKDTHEFFDTINEIENNKLSNVSSLKIRKFLKNLYDYTKHEELESNYKTNALPKLLITNFDNEQIWQQLELQNNEILKKNSSMLDNLLSVETYDEVKPKSQDIDDDVDSGQDEGSENSSESDLDESENFDTLEDEQSEDYMSEDGANQSSSDISKPTKSFKKSAVDDDFFNLQEMEEFLNSEEKKDNTDKKQDSDEDQDEDIDYFAEESDDSENTTAITAKFKDFFRKNDDVKKSSKNKLLEELSENEEADPTTFELRQNRLKKKIEDLENKAISEKPWTLKGEIRADSRPINSLLEEDVDFERCMRPAPIVTGQTTLKLEDIIKQRIKDRAFDSVEKKEIAVEKPYEFKKKLILNQEKSKESLAQIYEREYLEQKAALDPDHDEKEEEEPELHKEIKKSMKVLFEQLDALSNYHFTPKPAIPELKIVSNTPALYTEEVAPVAISDAPLLAPEEVKPKAKGDILGKSERTSTDKKRERRKKKAKQRYHAKLQEKKANGVQLNKKSKKGKEDEVMKVLSKDSSIKRVSQGNDVLKSSKTFFEQLENKKLMNSNSSNNNNKRKQNSDKRNVKKMKM